MCLLYVVGASGSQNRWLDRQELELQTIVSFYVCPGKQTRVLCKAKSALNHYTISLAYCLSVYLSNKTRCKIYTPQAIYFQALYIFFENHLPKNVMKVYAHIVVVCSPLS